MNKQAKKNTGMIIVFLIIAAVLLWMYLTPGKQLGMFTSSTTSYVCNPPSSSSLTGCHSFTSASLATCNSATLQCNQGSGYSCNNHCTTVSTTCSPNWQMTDWTPCSNGMQNRTAIDLNNCEATNGINVLPTTQTQSCTVPANPSGDNTWMWIVGGIGLLAIVFFLFKK